MEERNISLKNNFNQTIQTNMKLYKLKDTVLIEHQNKFYQKGNDNWEHLINRVNLHQHLLNEIDKLSSVEINLEELLNSKEIKAPIGSQEIWASGVTYMRSKEARMEESEDAGGADFYDKVYDADRPELFFKALANRVVGTNDSVFIRKDSTWNVPEPELTLFISSEGTIEGYTIGNDMSSRSIEGENPLYLPQAKVYERCAGLGPCIYVPKEPIASNTTISLEIVRNEKVMFEDKINIDQIKRKLTDLVSYLFRECEFPTGCFLMTGTGIVPPDSFTLEVDDIVKISIEGIGTLINKISKKA